MVRLKHSKDGWYHQARGKAAHDGLAVGLLQLSPGPVNVHDVTYNAAEAYARELGKEEMDIEGLGEDEENGEVDGPS